MSSYKSHMPPELEWKRLCGLGMNDEELRANDQLTEYLVHDLNTKPAMPFGDEEFDGAVVTVSVQYMTKPLETFREVCRVLKPGAPFIVTYSQPHVPDEGRAHLARARRPRARRPDHRRTSSTPAASTTPTAENRSIDSGAPNDPLFAVWARKLRRASRARLPVQCAATDRARPIDEPLGAIRSIDARLIIRDEGRAGG